MFIRKRLFKNVCKKPEKPWKLTKEQKHLTKLKEKNKDNYNKELEMMEQEYKSALLWHKYYCIATLKKKRDDKKEKKEKVKKEEVRAKIKEFKKAESEKKEEIQKIEKPEPLPEPEPEEPEIEEKIPEEEKFEKIIKDDKKEMEHLRKEQALLRIKREQEKQKRKTGKSV
jgi:hypothetical protein